MADITATARASSQDVSGCGATIKKVGGGNAPYFTEKLVVECTDIETRTERFFGLGTQRLDSQLT